MFQISVVNLSSTIADREMHRVIRAINRQIAEDFEPYWAFGGRLRLDGSIGPKANLDSVTGLRGDAIVYVLDDATSDDALGAHDRNLAGIPYGVVYLDLCKDLGEEWSVTLSHEALELIGDPQCNLLVQGPHPTIAGREVYHFFEMCDAVQGDSYEIDGVPVANFVLPSYFAPDETAAVANDFCATDLAAFSANEGGYIGYFDPVSGANEQHLGGSARAQLRFASKRARGAGRLVRRSMPELVARTRRMAIAPSVSDDPIEHVVVLMLENRSFDHMLGGLSKAIPGLDGVDRAAPTSNIDARTGASIDQTADAAPYVDENFNVPHEFTDVQLQLKDGMAHFVDAYVRQNPAATDAELKQVMAYFDEDKLPVLHTLAKNFVVCDRWFSSLPGPTWPNRLFVHSGTSKGDVIMPAASDPGTIRLYFGRYDQTTIYDRLAASGITWKVYHDGIPQSIVLDRLKGRWLTTDYQSIDDFVSAAAGPAQSFPQYAFIEPRYFKGLGAAEDDQHPPAGVLEGERLIAEVYNALRANDPLWNSTLLIVTYDEHGGFYDHVVPPATVAPDDNIGGGFAFDQLGVRVPTILVSPRVARGAVDHTVYDHTSILRYLCEKWGLPPLCRRTEPAAGAGRVGNFDGCIVRGDPRTDCPGPFPQVEPAPTAVREVPFDSARKALLAFAEGVMHDVVAKTGPSTHTLAALAAPLTPEQRAERVETLMLAAKNK